MDFLREPDVNSDVVPDRSADLRLLSRFLDCCLDLVVAGASSLGTYYIAQPHTDDETRSSLHGSIVARAAAIGRGELGRCRREDTSSGITFFFFVKQPSCSSTG